MSTLKLKTIKSLEGTGADAVTFTNADQVSFANPVSQPGAFMFRNKIINGNFDIWQRGTSQTTAGYGSADRWRCGNAGSTKTAGQQAFALGQTDVPNNPKYFMRHVVTSVAGASNYVSMQQYIEGVEKLSAKTAALSFWAKADDNKNIAVEFYQGFGTGGSPSTAVSGIEAQLITLTTSWTKYTITVDLPSVSGKTLGTDGNDFLAVFFHFDAGSNFDARTANLGQQSGTFDIAQVQLEEGAAATPFEMRPLTTEWSLCYRYYLSGVYVGATGYADGANQTSRCLTGVTFPVPMRTDGWTFTYANQSQGNTTGDTYRISPNQNRNGAIFTRNAAAAGSMWWYGVMIFEDEL